MKNLADLKALHQRLAAVFVRSAEPSGHLTLFREVITSRPVGGTCRVAHPITIPLLAAPAQAFGINDARATTATTLVFHVTLDWFLQINKRTLGITRRILPAQARAALNMRQRILQFTTSAWSFNGKIPRSTRPHSSDQVLRHIDGHFRPAVRWHDAAEYFHQPAGLIN